MRFIVTWFLFFVKIKKNYFFFYFYVDQVVKRGDFLFVKLILPSR